MLLGMPSVRRTRRWRTSLAGLVLCAFAGLGSPARAEGEGRLTVRFEGLTETGGELMISVANSRAVFENDYDAFLKAAIPVTGPSASVSFEGVAPGVYAVKGFHDTNGNRELDIGWTGPEEKFGFSNDAIGFMSPPDFDDAKFRFDGGDRTIVIRAR